jgi:LacI family transcriptional regulator
MVSIKDIAKSLGVSTATVSKALNNKPGISKEMRLKVLKKAEEMGYIINSLARGMKTSKTFTIGVLISDITNPFFSEVILSMERVLYAKKYNLIICNVGESHEKEREYLELLVSKKVDGIIAAPTADGQNVSIYRNLIRHGMKIVLFDRLIPEIETDSVVIDNRAAIYDAVRYLAKKGHRKIGFIYGIENSYTGCERLKGFREAVKDLGLESHEEWIRSGYFRESESHECALEILKGKERPTAMVAANDFTTLGIMRAAKEIGLKIPEEFSIIGFDDLEWMSIYSPPITTISQPTDVIGMSAATLLLDALENEGIHPLRHVVLKTTLVERESVSNISSS